MRTIKKNNVMNALDKFLGTCDKIVNEKNSGITGISFITYDDKGKEEEIVIAEKKETKP